MNQEIETLIKLQKMDISIDSLKNKAKEIPLCIEKTKTDFETKNTNLESLKQELARIQLDKKQKEMDLHTKEEERKKHQSELNKVKKNDQYFALQKEIDQLGKDISVIEDGILNMMDSIETVNTKMKQEQDLLKQEEGKLGQEINRFTGELESINKAIADQETQRREITATIPAESLTLYERIRKSKKGMAVAEVMKNNSCGGCHMTLPPQVVNEVRKLDRLVLCESCSRILFWKGE
ncbi:MAG: C4-type zinc ribbon domain-containing protein [bacterium]|nr:C4-type zinc ribbon domain-containing protein [bacterium]